MAMPNFSSPEPKRQLSPEASVVQQAIGGDRAALESMFRNFLPMDEAFVAVEYLGVKGLFNIGHKSFGAITATRVARIELGIFGEVLYQEALIRDINSAVVYQPSQLQLYLIVGALVVLAFFSRGLTLLLIPFAPFVYYRLVKSGFVLGVREGIFVYAFADRARLPRIRFLLTALAKQR